MTLDEIKEMAKVDLEIDKTDLIGSSIDTPILSNKYYCILIEQKKIMNLLEQKLLILYKETFEYYNGNADAEVYIKRPLGKKILKGEIEKYINADPIYQDLITKIKKHEEKVKYLDFIVKQLNNRGFLIKSIIDEKKFQNGGY